MPTRASSPRYGDGMSRIPYAAQTLIDQVTERRKSAKVTIEQDPDGFDVNRVIKFDKATSAWLRPILEAVADPRIVGLGTVKDQLTVIFSARTNADERDEFALDEADAVLSE